MAPKHDLMVNLQVMLQEKQVVIAARIAGMAELLKEMGQMRVKVGGAGREQFGAWREGEHDDLVLAVALACWAVKRDYPGRGDEFRQSVAHPPRDRRESVVFSPSSLQSHTKVK